MIIILTLGALQLTENNIQFYGQAAIDGQALDVSASSLAVTELGKRLPTHFSSFCPVLLVSSRTLSHVLMVTLPARVHLQSLEDTCFFFFSSMICQLPMHAVESFDAIHLSVSRPSVFLFAHLVASQSDTQSSFFNSYQQSYTHASVR